MVRGSAGLTQQGLWNQCSQTAPRKPWCCLQSWAPRSAGGPETKLSAGKAHKFGTSPNVQERGNRGFEPFSKYTQKTAEIPKCSSTTYRITDTASSAGPVSQINSTERFQRVSVPREHMVLLWTTNRNRISKLSAQCASQLPKTKPIHHLHASVLPDSAYYQ